MLREQTFEKLYSLKLHGLAQAFEHMAGANNEKIASPDQLETLRRRTFFGREKDNTIYPIALANLILHGIDEPRVWHGNTLTGAETYYGVTTIDTRSTPGEFMTQGWFIGLIPITVPVAATSFGAAARAAQDSFDWGTEMADVPFDRVLELAPWLRTPRPYFPVLNFFDAGVAPLSAIVASLGGSTISLYVDGRSSDQLPISVSRLATETVVTVWCPNNPVARESVTRYLGTMRSMCIAVGDGRTRQPRRTA